MPESFDQQRAAVEIVADEPCATVAPGQPQDRDLMASGVEIARHDQLQYDGRSLRESGLGDKGLGRVLVGATHGDGPVALEAGDQVVELADPLVRAHGDRLVAHDRWQSVHEKSILAPASVPAVRV